MNNLRQRQTHAVYQSSLTHFDYTKESLAALLSQYTLSAM